MTSRIFTSLFALVLATASACSTNESTDDMNGGGDDMNGSADMIAGNDLSGSADMTGGHDLSAIDSGTTDGSVPVIGWTKQFGEASAKEIEGAKAVATDAAGNIIIVGDIWGAANFGGGVLTSAGGQDGFVAKLDPNGNHIFSIRFGDVKSYQVASAVAVDSAGNIVVAGEFDGTVDLGGGPLTTAGSGDILVAKLDPSGKHIWSKRYGDASDGQRARSVTVDSAGNVLVAGELTGTVDFGGGPLASIANGGADAFVLKLDADGNHVWSRRYGGGGKTTAAGIRTDASNNVVFVGEFGLTVAFNTSGAVDGGVGTVLSSFGGQDGYVTKLDLNGEPLFSKRLGGTSKDTGDAVAIDALGNIAVATTFRGTANLGGTNLVAPGTGPLASNVGIVKLTPDGSHVFSFGYGDDAPQQVNAVTFDRAGNLLLAGQFTGAINFGATALTSKAKSLFIAKLDGLAGSEVWSKQFGDQGEVNTGGITTDPAGKIIFAGRFAGRVDFGHGAHTTAGDYDVLVAKLADAK